MAFKLRPDGRLILNWCATVVFLNSWQYSAHYYLDETGEMKHNHLTTSDVNGASKLPVRPASDDSPDAWLLRLYNTNRLNQCMHFYVYCHAEATQAYRVQYDR